MAPSRIADAVGRVLGDRYRLTRPLGAGASAYVFVADDVVLRRRVAVKVLHPGLADDEGFLRRFRAEAQVVASLRHPNILRVYDWGEEDGSPYLVMELLEGGSLRGLLDGGHLLTPAQAASVGVDAAKALDYAHRRGLVHSDIKPANLIFDEEGRISVADFGLARALAEATWTEPAGAVVGTARYAAPEQALGRSLDDRADVYSLALVLVEATTGTVPFAADTTIATLMARVERPLRAPDATGPLAAAIDAAGAVDAADRPSAGEFAVALGQAASRLPPPAPLPLSGGLIDGGADVDVDPTDYPGRPRLFDAAAVDGGIVPPAGRQPSGRPAAPQRRLADDERGTAPPTAKPRRMTRRRVRLLVAALLLVAAVVVAAVVASKALVPSHPVPPLLGETERQAAAALRPAHLHLVVSGREYSSRPAGTVAKQQPDSGKLQEGKAVDVVLSLGPKPVAVPAIGNLTEAQAQADVSGAGLKLVVSARRSSMTVPSGSVISATPSSGTLLPGQTVSVVVSTGKPMVAVPQITGGAAASFAGAQGVLSHAGLGAVEVQQFSDSVARGAVIAVSPAAGQSVVVGSAVTVYVSKGPQLFPVPNVRGDSVNQAALVLTDGGFDVSGVTGNPTAAVTGTDPPAGTLLRKQSAILILTG